MSGGLSSVRSDWRRFRPATPEEEPDELKTIPKHIESETLLQTPETSGVLAAAVAPLNLIAAGGEPPVVADARVFIPVDQETSPFPVEPPSLEVAPAAPLELAVELSTPEPQAAESPEAAVVEASAVSETVENAASELVTEPALAREPELDNAAAMADDAVPAAPEPVAPTPAEPVAVESVSPAPDPAPTEEIELRAQAETAATGAIAEPPVIEEAPRVIEEVVEPASIVAVAAEESVSTEPGAVESVEAPAEAKTPDAKLAAAPAIAEEIAEEAPATAAAVISTPTTVEAKSEPAATDHTDSQPPAATAQSGIEETLADAVASQPQSTPDVEAEPEVEAAPTAASATPEAPATASPKNKGISVAASAGAASLASSPLASSRERDLVSKPSTRPLPALHRSQVGAPCPVCAGTRWMKVSATLERCPRCSVLRLDPGDEAVQPMETQDLVILRRVEAFRRESRERVMAVMNASHVSTGDLAELSLTPEQLADLRADGNPHIFGSFGLCVLPFALEQSREPVALLRSVHDMLVPGGRLLVASFDPLSLRSLIFGAQWSGLRLPGQVYSFRRQHVERMLREAGFEKPRVERVSGCLRAAKPSHDHGPKFEMLALWRTIQNWGAASMFDAAKA